MLSISYEFPFHCLCIEIPVGCYAQPQVMAYHGLREWQSHQDHFFPHCHAAPEICRFHPVLPHPLVYPDIIKIRWQNDVFHTAVNNDTIVDGKIGILQFCQHCLYFPFYPNIILIGKEDNVPLCMPECILEVVRRAVKGEGGRYLRRVMMEDANPFVSIRLDERQGAIRRVIVGNDNLITVSYLRQYAVQLLAQIFLSVVCRYAN